MSADSTLPADDERIPPLTAQQLGLCGPRSDDTSVGPDAARQSARADSESWTHGFPDPERDATREALDQRDAARIRATALSGLWSEADARVAAVHRAAARWQEMLDSGEITAASPGDAVLRGVVARLGAVLVGPAEAPEVVRQDGSESTRTNSVGPAESLAQAAVAWAEVMRHEEITPDDHALTAAVDAYLAASTAPPKHRTAVSIGPAEAAEPAPRAWAIWDDAGEAGAPEPALIGTWADPEFRAHQDHKHAVDGCGFCPSEEDR